MLYIFAGFPRSNLTAGGLQHVVEDVEELAILEHDPSIQYRKEGVFTPTYPNDDVEMLYPIEYRLSDRCLQDGITWDWFPEHWTFGNGVTVHKTVALAQYRLVVHGTNLTLEQFLFLNGSTRPSDLRLGYEHHRHESWREYEARWLPSTCPQESHVVHLTWLVTTHRLPEFAYEDIRALVEDTASYPDLDHEYFSIPRVWKVANDLSPVS